MDMGKPNEWGSGATGDYERIGRLIYGLQRICGGVEGLRGLKTDPGVAPDTAERGIALADRYDMLVTRDVTEVGITEVESLLSDAAELMNMMGQEG
jgi:hypothetical protein